MASIPFVCIECRVPWFVVRSPRTEVEVCPYCGSENVREIEEPR